MKKLAVAICAAVLVMGLAACSSGAASGSASSASAEASSSAAASSAATSSDAATSSAAASSAAASSAAASASAAASSSAAAAVDVSTVDFDVAAMSDEEAFKFMDEFTNRTPDQLEADNGKVMHIKGQVSRYTKNEGDVKKVSCSVGIKGEGGVLKGVNFYVEGWTGDDYPENKAKVEVTGVWGVVEGYGTSAGRTLICNAEDVKVL